MPKKEETQQLFVRIPVSTYQKIRENCGGERALGAFVNKSILNYLDQPTIIAKAVLKALRDEVWVK